MPIKVLIVDDDQLVREGLSVLSKISSEIEIVGEAVNGLRAIEQVENLNPDIVLMDIRMPEMDGITATRIINQKYPQTKVLILTTFDDEVLIKESIETDAVGYILKATSFDDMIQAILSAHRGFTQYSSGILKKSLNLDSLANSASDSSDILKKLTYRELQVLSLVLEDCGNKEIAQKLSILEQSAKNYISRIIRLLNLDNRKKLVVFATPYLATIKNYLQNNPTN